MQAASRIRLQATAETPLAKTWLAFSVRSRT